MLCHVVWCACAHVLEQVITPHVPITVRLKPTPNRAQALNCLVTCHPSGNEFDNSALQLRHFSRTRGMITSCRYLEERYQECSKKEGVVVAMSVETLGVDLRTRTKLLEAKERSRRQKCEVILVYEENRIFQKSHMRTGMRKLSRTGLVPARAWGGQAVGIAPTERLKLGRQIAAAAGAKESVGRKQCGSGRRIVHDGHAAWAGRNVDGKMGKGAEGGMEKAKFRGAHVEASERTCRSCYVRDPIQVSNCHSGTP